MQLTAKACETAQPRGQEYLLADGNDLYLLVLPNGTKSWRFIYTAPGGRRRKKSLGTFPKVVLATARQRAREEHQLLAAGKHARAVVSGWIRTWPLPCITAADLRVLLHATTAEFMSREFGYKIEERTASNLSRLISQFLDALPEDFKINLEDLEMAGTSDDNEADTLLSMPGSLVALLVGGEELGNLLKVPLQADQRQALIEAAGQAALLLEAAIAPVRQRVGV
jgi:hypothetical protein